MPCATCLVSTAPAVTYECTPTLATTPATTKRDAPAPTTAPTTAPTCRTQAPTNDCWDVQVGDCPNHYDTHDEGKLRGCRLDRNGVCDGFHKDGWNPKDEWVRVCTTAAMATESSTATPEMTVDTSKEPAGYSCSVRAA